VAPATLRGTQLKKVASAFTTNLRKLMGCLIRFSIADKHPLKLCLYHSFLLQYSYADAALFCKLKNRIVTTQTRTGCFTYWSDEGHVRLPFCTLLLAVCCQNLRHQAQSSTRYWLFPRIVRKTLILLSLPGLPVSCSQSLKGRGAVSSYFSMRHYHRQAYDVATSSFCQPRWTLWGSHGAVSYHPYDTYRFAL
jgi:hypothetical protein